jgi:rRNA-processing protein FCF1
MKQVILDTNFILSCIRKKIDFFDEIQLMGIKIIIPEQVINEIKKFETKKSEAKLALKLLERKEFKKIDLGKGYVDKKIINYAKENPGLIIATLDREMKNKTKNQKLVIRGNRLEVV